MNRFKNYILPNISSFCTVARSPTATKPNENIATKPATNVMATIVEEECLERL